MKPVPMTALAFPLLKLRERLEYFSFLFHFFILNSRKRNQPYQLNLPACLTSFSESMIYGHVSNRAGSSADRPNLLHHGSDGGIETWTGSLALITSPPVVPTLSCLVMPYGGFPGPDERGQALTGTPPFRPWTFPEYSPLRQ